jgi:hypothetical protein
MRETLTDIVRSFGVSYSTISDGAGQRLNLSRAFER